MRSIRTALFCLIFGLALALVTTVPLAHASETDGTILAPDIIAKGVNPLAGDFNFGIATTGVTVHVTDTALTGYVWSENYGWINLGPLASSSGVVNDAEGNLSGYAWGQNLGFINFNPNATSSPRIGVTIDEDGVFHGYAWSTNIGWISFNCDNDDSCGTDDFKLVTDWRPASTRNPGGGGGGGGGGGSTPTCTSNCEETPEVPCTVNCTPENPEVPCTVNCNPETPCTVNCGPTTPEEPCTVNCGPEVPCTTNCPPEPPCTTDCPPEPPVEPDPENPVTEIIETITETIRDIPEAITRVAERTKETLDEVATLVNTETGNLITKTITTGALAVAAITAAMTVLFANPLVLTEVFFIPARLLSLIMSAFGLKRKTRPWGTVYDSVTKMPLDPAYVVLTDEAGKEIATSFTDLDGRYGFFVPKGTYYLTASKTNYVFPSKKMAGRAGDEMYTDLYFGEKITVAEDGEVIYRNIPMDQVNFDWNEFAKNNMKVMKFHSKRERIFVLISAWLFRIGFVVAIVSLYAAPQPYNLIIFFVYVLMLGLRMLGVRKRINGSIIEQSTGNPLSFAIVSVYSESLGRELLKKVADQYGRYYTLVPTGEYTIKVSKKNADESYTEVYSQPYNAKNGVVNLNIRV